MSTNFERIMMRAKAAVLAHSSTDLAAYDDAMEALEQEVRQALGVVAAEPTDPYMGLPIRAAMLSEGPFIAFDVPDDTPIRLSPDLMQMMDDMSMAAGVMHG